MTNPYGSTSPPDPWAAQPPAAPAEGGGTSGSPAWSPTPPPWTPTAPAWTSTSAWTSTPTDSQWGSPAAPVSPTTNTWAVVALVTGLLGLVPVAVPAAIAGLVQTSRRRQAGRGLAIAGLVAACLWTVVAVVLVAVFVTTDDARAGTPADVGTVAVGDCVDAPGDGADRWTPASCSALHDGEVYLVQELDDASWPGEDDLELLADDTCHAEFADYVGRSYIESAYDYQWFSPGADDWAGGERRLVCLVVPYDEDVLRSPVRGSGD